MILLANSIKNSYGTELRNKDPKEIDSTLLVDTRLNIIGKKIKKKNFIDCEFKNNYSI